MGAPDIPSSPTPESFPRLQSTTDWVISYHSSPRVTAWGLPPRAVLPWHSHVWVVAHFVPFMSQELPPQTTPLTTALLSSFRSFLASYHLTPLLMCSLFVCPELQEETWSGSWLNPLAPTSTTYHWALWSLQQEWALLPWNECLALFLFPTFLHSNFVTSKLPKSSNYSPMNET